MAFPKNLKRNSIQNDSKHMKGYCFSLSIPKAKRKGSYSKEQTNFLKMLLKVISSLALNKLGIYLDGMVKATYITILDFGYRDLCLFVFFSSHVFSATPFSFSSSYFFFILLIFLFLLHPLFYLSSLLFCFFFKVTVATPNFPSWNILQFIFT